MYAPDIEHLSFKAKQLVLLKAHLLNKNIVIKLKKGMIVKGLCIDISNYIVYANAELKAKHRIYLEDVKSIYISLNT